MIHLALAVLILVVLGQQFMIGDLDERKADKRRGK